MQGIVLIAHGSRREEANQDLADLAVEVARRRPDAIVEIGYLELARPTIDEGLEKCVARGATQIIMLPYFLSTGIHVTRDLDAARKEFAQRHSQIDVVQAGALGLHPQMIDIVIERITEAAGGDSRRHD